MRVLVSGKVVAVTGLEVVRGGTQGLVVGNCEREGVRRRSETRVRDGSKVGVRGLVSGKVVGMTGQGGRQEMDRGRERREMRTRGQLRRETNDGMVK